MKNILISFFLLASTSLVAQWNLTGSSLYPANFSTVNVGIGTDAPAEKLHINGSVRGNQAGGALRINTQFGSLDLGPMNSGWSHFQTSMTKFHFNKPVHIDGALSSYSTLDLDLQTNGTQRLRILNSNGHVGIGTTMPQGTLHVGQIRPIIMKSNGGSGVYGSEIGFNAVLDTYVDPVQFKKFGGTSQKGGAAIVVNHTGSMFFQMYNADTEVETIVDYLPQVTFLHTGSVGIGTTSPVSKLHVSGGNIQVNSGHLIFDYAGGSSPAIYTGVGGAELNKYLLLMNSPSLTSASGLKAGGILVADQYGYASPGKNDLIVKGNVGVGVISPATKLDVAGHLKATSQFHLGDNYSSSNRGIVIDNGASTSWEFLTLKNGGGTYMKVLGNGNVGIGTTTPDQKLTVDGVVKCEEVRVEIFTGTGPDYVFAPDYNLLPLSEVESYIKANKHLPEVPSAKQMEEEGLNLKEMNLLLLKKVEELTLHLIEMKKENGSLQQQLSDQNIRLKKIEKSSN